MRRSIRKNLTNTNPSVSTLFIPYLCSLWPCFGYSRHTYCLKVWCNMHKYWAFEHFSSHLRNAQNRYFFVFWCDQIVTRMTPKPCEATKTPGCIRIGYTQQESNRRSLYINVPVQKDSIYRYAIQKHPPSSIQPDTALRLYLTGKHTGRNFLSGVGNHQHFSLRF